MHDSPSPDRLPKVWQALLRRWSHIGHPLRPTPEDIATYERFAARAACEGNGRLRALLLGVTPQIVGCRWPDGTSLTALDISSRMIGTFWPVAGAPAAARVICGDWCAMPVEAGSIDFVVSDGCNPVLPFPRSFQAMVGEAARVLRPGGLLVLRLFLRRDPGETVDDIVAALRSDRIGSVHVLKWRLVAALCPDIERGICLGDVWPVWDRMRHLVPRPGAPGWTPEEIETIDVYHNLETQFYFPTLAQVRCVMAQDFADMRHVCGSYEHAEQCPTIVCVKPA
jgi:SAM-dependent methyltransferase